MLGNLCSKFLKGFFSQTTFATHYAINNKTVRSNVDRFEWRVGASIAARPKIQKIHHCGPPPCLREELFGNISGPVRDSVGKVTVVGAGMVGIACVTSILFQKISGHVAMVDAFPKKMEGEAWDLNHGAGFIDDPKIEYDTDFSISRNSRVVVLTAGARQKKDESRLDLLKRNVDIFKNIVPPLVQYSPEAVFIVASNPVDLLSWLTWKLSGLPVHKVIGTGTQLDSMRFRYLIAKRLGVSPSSVGAWIIGEHGDSQVPLWSSVNVAGVRFQDIVSNIGSETDNEKWNDLHDDVIKAAPKVRCLKGYTNTAIGLCIADLVNSVSRNRNNVRAVSTLVRGHHGIRDEIFLSLPAVIGGSGVTKIVNVRITEREKKQLLASAKIIAQVQRSIQV